MTPMSPTSRGVREALTRAAVFLNAQLVAGHYGLSCVGTDGTPRFSDGKGHVFTGFFLAEALGDSLSEIGRTILLVRILSEEQEGLWGFSPPAPYVEPEHEAFIVDADDTAYVLRTLRRLGAPRPPRRLLTFHRAEVNAFVTFNGSGIARLVDSPSAEHNLLVHPEVNANVFLALHGTNYARYVNEELVRQTQTAEGWWPSYFYPGRFFGTALFLDLLHVWGGFEDAKRRARAFLLDSQNAEGGWGASGEVLDTAHALRALLNTGEGGSAVRRGVEYLLDCRTVHGVWASSASLWEFHAGGGDVWRAHDPHGTLVTALCAMALRRADRS